MLRSIREFFYRSRSSLEDFNVLKNILSEQYALGTFVRCRRIHKGYVNVSYELEMFRDGKTRRYLLRWYRKGIRGRKIRFEHALLRQLFKRQFVLSPRVIDTKYGKTYVKLEQKPRREIRQTSYLAVFTFLQGEDKYSWDNPSCTPKELADAARVLALYHHKVFGWNSEYTWQKPIFVDYIPVMLGKWRHYVQQAESSCFDRYFLQHVGDLSACVKRVSASLGADTYAMMPRVAIHGDYHPGNLKFQETRVSGVFDFDWAKIDARCFDVSLAVNYFCTSWDGAHDGALQLDRVETFLEAYQETAQEKDGLGVLHPLELHYFPEMMLMSNFSTIDWTIKNFYFTRPDPEEYETYLRHNVELTKWLEHHKKTLRKCALKYQRAI